MCKLYSSLSFHSFQCEDKFIYNFMLLWSLVQLTCNNIIETFLFLIELIKVAKLWCCKGLHTSRQWKQNWILSFTWLIGLDFWMIKLVPHECGIWLCLNFEKVYDWLSYFINTVCDRLTQNKKNFLYHPFCLRFL